MRPTDPERKLPPGMKTSKRDGDVPIGRHTLRYRQSSLCVSDDSTFGACGQEGAKDVASYVPFHGCSTAGSSQRAAVA